MTRKLWLLLVVVLSSGLIAAGCGDDDDDGGSSDEPTTEESGGSAEDTGGSGATPANVEEAVKACEQSIQSNAQLSQDAKDELEGICQDAAEGDEEAVREATKKVCLKVIEETGVTGPAVDQAKQACEQTAP